MTTAEAHQAAYVGMLDTVERIERDKLADRMALYRRGAEPIYTNELRGGEWLREPGARAALEAERGRPMTLQERREYADGFDKLAALIVRPERQASTAELHNIERLQQRAQVVVQARERIAASVERGKIPEVMIRDECAELGSGPERSRGR